MLSKGCRTLTCVFRTKREFSGSCGIVGLPNVGKSTLFNALTSTQAAEAANYPFCTIEPNVAKVAVSDARLRRLAQIQILLPWLPRLDGSLGHSDEVRCEDMFFPWLCRVS